MECLPSGAKPRCLLAASAIPPWPPANGYSLRAGNFLKQLARNWRVTVVSPAGESDQPGPDGIQWHRLEHLPTTVALPWNARRSLLTESLLSLVRKKRYSAGILWAGTEFVKPEIQGFPPAVVDRIDCGTLQAWRRLNNRNRLRKKLRQLRHSAQLALYEHRMLRYAHGIVVTGPDDARALRLVSRHPEIRTIPNGVSLPSRDERSKEADVPTVIFTGVLSYDPNVEAVRFFTERIWPKVRNQVPTARLVVAGRSPVPEISSLGESPSISVRADVPDLTKELRKAWVAIAPMRSGSGIKNKVLEAWAAERPVVMTKMATNGLRLDEADAALRELVSDTPTEVAQTVVELLTDQSRRRSLGRKARYHAESHHSWETAGQSLDEFIREVAQLSQSSPAPDGSAEVRST